MKTAARKDANHKEIAKAFEDKGFVVLDLSQLKNCCDIVVCKYGITIMVEIKDSAKPPSARKLTEGEIKFAKKWSQQGHWQLVTSVVDVIKINSNIRNDWKLNI